MILTKNYYTSTNTDHTKFGGLIFYSDFNTDYRKEKQEESSIARRIMDDWKFDEKCRKNIESRNRKIRKEVAYATK